MGLKNGFNKAGGLLLTAVLLLLLSACAGTRPAPVPEPVPETGLPQPEMVITTGHKGQIPDARVSAAHSLTRQGFNLLRNEDYDSAIRVLERAVGVNPADGPGYFYLAEAWLAKGNRERAARFNDLAALYLRGDRQWACRAAAQQERISRTRPEER
ncbi:MAG: tetratricopeptide repeat protein [Desulfosudaceae bacterium]